MSRIRPHNIKVGDRVKIITLRGKSKIVIVDKIEEESIFYGTITFDLYTSKCGERFYLTNIKQKVRDLFITIDDDLEVQTRPKTNLNDK